MEKEYVDFDSLLSDPAIEGFEPLIVERLAKYYASGDQLNSLFYLSLANKLEIMDEHDYQYNLALIEIDMGCYQYAERILEKLLSSYPQDVDYHLASIRLFQKSGNYKEAEKRLDDLAGERWVKREPAIQERINIMLGLNNIHWYLKEKKKDYLEEAFDILREQDTLVPEEIPKRAIDEKAVKLVIDYTGQHWDPLGRACGQLQITQKWGNDCLIIAIKTVIHFKDKTRFIGPQYELNEVAGIFGTPFWRAGITRKTEPCAFLCDIYSHLDLDQTPMKGRYAYIEFQLSFIDDQGEYGFLITPHFPLSDPDHRLKDYFEELYWSAENNYNEYFVLTIQNIQDVNPDYVPEYPVSQEDPTGMMAWGKYLEIRKLVLDSANLKDAYMLWAGDSILLPNYVLLGGIIKQSMGDDEDAAEIYSQVLDIDPSNRWALLNLGILNYDQGYAGEAEYYFRNVLAIDSTFAMAYYCLGIVYQYHYNRLEEALKFYLKYDQYKTSLVYDVWDWIRDVEGKLKDEDQEIIFEQPINEDIDSGD
ncbi:hypothetical protein JW877_06040 [bacterium]|nr:hypothetical protein [bacterium]